MYGLNPICFSWIKKSLLLFIIQGRGLVQLPVPFLMLSIYESLKPLCVLRRRGMGVSNTMQPLMDMGCMRGVLQGDWFRGTQQIYKKANGCRTLSRIERNFLRYRSFFPFTLMVVILALFLIRAYYISFLPYMSYTYISFYSNMWIYEDLNIYDLSYI